MVSIDTCAACVMSCLRSTVNYFCKDPMYVRAWWRVYIIENADAAFANYLKCCVLSLHVKDDIPAEVAAKHFIIRIVKQLTAIDSKDISTYNLFIDIHHKIHKHVTKQFKSILV